MGPSRPNRQRAAKKAAFMETSYDKAAGDKAGAESEAAEELFG